MIWNDEYETLPREAMEALQLKRLRALVDRLSSTVPFYKRKLAEVGYKPGDLRKLDDLSRLPFTTKDDLRTIIRSASSPCPWSGWSGFTRHRGRRGSPRWWATPAATSTPGRS